MGITIKGKGAAIGKATITSQKTKDATPETEVETVATTASDEGGEKKVQQVADPKQAQTFDGSDEPTRIVKIAMGFTKNLGDYQSARFDVGIEIPCLESYTDATADFATDWVNARLEKLVD